MNLNCADIVKYDDRLFILTRDTQYLFEYFPISGKFNLCGTVRSEPEQSFVSMTLCDDKIYIAPYEANNFCIYDIKKRVFRRIPLNKFGGKGKKKHYKVCFSYQQKVYFLGGRGTIILCVDTNTDTVEEIVEWNESFNNKFGFETWIRSHQICIVDHCFWVALEGHNILLQYNMLTKEYFFWNIGLRTMQYVTVNFDGEYFWLSGEEKVIVRWKKETNEFEEFDAFPKGFKISDGKEGWKELFSSGYIWNDNIYFVPLNSNMLVKLECVSNQIKCIIKTDIRHICFRIIEINNEELYVEEDNIENFLFHNGYLINREDKYMNFSISIERQDVLRGIFDIKSVKMENNIIVEGFPECILKLLQMLREEMTLDNNINQSMIGRKIWDCLI